MFVKMLIGSKANTDEKYRMYIQKRQKLWVALAVIGVLTLGVGILCGMNVMGDQASFLSGLYSGLGAAMLAVAFGRAMKDRKLLKSSEVLHSERLKAQDERLIAVGEKSLSLSGLIAIGFAYVGLLVSGFFNMTVFWTLWVVVIAYAVIYTITFAIMNRRM